MSSLSPVCMMKVEKRNDCSPRREPAVLSRQEHKLGILILALFCLGSGTVFAQGSPLPVGRAIMEEVNARGEGATMRHRTNMQLINRQGKVREREMVSVRKYFGEERRSVLFFTRPSKEAGTAFLTYDYGEEVKEDDQWLYLPALRKVRRISASERGAYFMGTDFTYADIKQGMKVPVGDFRWTTIGEETVDGAACYVVEGLPASEALAKDLGYGKTLVYVDTVKWLVRKATFWDTNLNLLKTVTTAEVQKVQGIWTIHRIEAENHKTEHKTIMRISDVEYDGAVRDSMFDRHALERGP